jgi:hypothetical protein
MHTASVSTWKHVERVRKNAYCTPKQALKIVANPKSNRSQLQSCANSKTATRTYRTKRNTNLEKTFPPKH